MNKHETWLYLICVNFLIYLTASQGCEFPEDWRGQWYLTGYVSDTSIEVSITHNTFSERGTCQRSMHGINRFLLYKQTQNGNGRYTTDCYSCVIFIKRHDNILQYKQGDCQLLSNDQDFDRICDGIDSVSMKTLVRVNAAPIQCPQILRNHEAVPFSYSLISLDLWTCNNQTGSPSQITSCASDTRATIHYESCPFDGDADNFRPSLGVKEVQCLAQWDGDGKWLYLKYGDSYRCSRLEDDTLSLSTDGDCASLSSFFSAPITIFFQMGSLRGPFDHGEIAQPLCDYPDWFKEYTEGLSDLSGSLNYQYESETQQLVVYKKLTDGSLDTLQIHSCVQKIWDRPNERKFITRVINGCSQGYQCIVLRKRADGIIDYHAGQITSLQEHSCTESKLYSVSQERQLLIDPNLDPVECPAQFRGRHTLHNQAHRCPITAEVGCDESYSLMNIKECETEKAQLQCRANWIENGQQYMVMSELAGSYNCLKFGEVHLADGNYNHIDFGDCNYEANSIIPTYLPQPPYTLSASPEQCSEAEGEYEKAKIITIKDDRSIASSLSHSLLLTGLLVFSVFGVA